MSHELFFGGTELVPETTPKRVWYISGSNSMSGVSRECYYELVALPSSAIIQFYKQRQLVNHKICTVQGAIFDGQGDMMSGKRGVPIK